MPVEDASLCGGWQLRGRRTRISVEPETAIKETRMAVLVRVLLISGLVNN